MQNTHAKMRQPLEEATILIQMVRDLCGSGVRCNCRTLDFLKRQIEKLGVLPRNLIHQSDGQQSGSWHKLRDVLKRGKGLVEMHTKNFDLRKVCQVSSVVREVEKVCRDLKLCLTTLNLGDMVKIDTSIDSRQFVNDCIYMEWFLLRIVEKMDGSVEMESLVRNELKGLEVQNAPHIQRTRFTREADIAFDVPLGEGPCGQVFKACWSGFDVAVKVLSLKVDQISVEAFADFLTDVGLHMRLKDQNVMQCFAVSKSGCIVMQLADRNLQEFYKKMENLTWDVKLQLMLQAAKGLKFLHSQGIVHGAVKSRNFLVRGVDPTTCLVKIADFGYPVIRKEMGRRHHAGKKKADSDLWLAPEIQRGRSHDFKSDVFSFGVVLFELASQRAPYANMNETQRLGRKQRWGDPCPLPWDCSRDLRHLMASCIDPNPSRRPSMESICSHLSMLNCKGAPTDFMSGSGFKHKPVASCFNPAALKSVPVRFPSNTFFQDKITARLATSTLTMRDCMEEPYCEMPTQLNPLYLTECSTIAECVMQDTADSLISTGPPPAAPSPFAHPSLQMPPPKKSCRSPKNYHSLDLERESQGSGINAEWDAQVERLLASQTVQERWSAVPWSGPHRVSDLNESDNDSGVRWRGPPIKVRVSDNPRQVKIREIKKRTTSALQGDVKKVEVLKGDVIKDGWAKRGSRKNGVKTLASAVKLGLRDTVIALLDGGANIQARWKDDFTALMIAAEEGHLEIINVLLARGAQIDASNKFGSTALMIAALEGHVGAVSRLVEKGASIEARDSERDTALTIASFEGHADVVKVLLTKGADIRAHDKDGNTALHCAAMNGHRAVVELLIELGAKRKIRNKVGFFRGQTPARIAKLNGYTEIERLIKYW